jgi:hypothetical protein
MLTEESNSYIMRDKRKKRIIHLPTSVGNVANSLSRELKNLGYSSKTLVLYGDRRFATADKVVATRTHSALAVELRKLLALSYVFHCEGVVFNFGSTLFNPAMASTESTRLVKLTSSEKKRGFLLKIWRAYTSLMQRVELFLLNLRRVQIVVIYQGDDIRQERTNVQPGETSLETMGPEDHFSHNLDILKRKQAVLMGKVCSGIFALNPDLLQFLPHTAKFLPYFHVPLDQVTPRYPSLSSSILQIAHAPTNRQVKGTEYIISAVEKLKSEGYALSLDLIENRTHEETFEAIAQCDVYIDQLVVGWYGGVAVEAMALGKPTVAFLSEQSLSYCPAEFRENTPIIRSSPSAITQTLRELAQRRKTDLVELGRESQRFANRYHQPRQAVEILLGHL